MPFDIEEIVPSYCASDAGYKDGFELEAFLDEVVERSSGPQDILALFPTKPASNLSSVYQCSVCSEAAGRHLYYGARTCPSCRFRDLK